MKRMLSALIALGIIAAMPAATVLSTTTAVAGSYDGDSGGYKPKTYYPKKQYYPKKYYPKKEYYPPKKEYYPPKKEYYPPKKEYTPPPSYKYDGEYPSDTCYGEKTYEPPSGYVNGCEPPPDWVAYCSYKYQDRFNEENGYYFGDDKYYHYCR
jgi:hypothetical protein